jgi:hypothetical protein
MRISVRRIQHNSNKRPNKEEARLQSLKKERQGLLSKDIETEVSQGAQILNNRKINGREVKTHRIPANYFVDNSVLRIMYYDRIDDEDTRAQAIENDIVFVYAEVRRLNDKYKLWNVSIHEVWEDYRKTHVIVVKEK